MEDKQTLVQTSLMPFTREFKTLYVKKDMTIVEIMKVVNPRRFQGCNVVVTLNNEVIPEIVWEKVVCGPKDIVSFNVIPSGKGSGRDLAKQAAVITIALGAAFLGAWAASAYLVAATGATGATTAAATAAAISSASAGQLAVAAGIQIGVSMLGSLASSAIMKTPKQRESVADKDIPYVQGGGNVLNRYGVIPVNLGTNRVYPPLAAMTYTESSGRINYSRQLFTFGYGDVSIEEERIGDTLLTEYDEVETDYRLNSDLYLGTELYTDDVYQESLSLKLLKEEGYVIRTTHSDVDEINFDITFSKGLYVVYGSNKNKYGKGVVNFGVSYSLSGENNWSTEEEFEFKDLYRTSLTVTKRLKLPTTGRYDIRIRKLSDEGDNTSKIFNETYLTTFRNITYVQPVKQKYISGLAMRIKATDQLNGSVDKYNVILSTRLKVYSPENNQWNDNQISSNPADIFRYVLQSDAFAKKIPDEQIDLEKLQEWWVYCNDNNLTYNRYIDYDASINEIINDICAAGVATVTKVQNIWSVIIDNERPMIKGMITPRNSWGYSGSINYPEIPHALRVEFRNKDKLYETDERIVYADGYDETNATLYERLQFQSCTDSDLAYWYGRRYLATAILQPETHTFKMDYENLTFNRGDRITLVNDVVLIGVGQGRIKELLVDNVENPSQVLGIIIDDDISIPTSNNFGVRIRRGDGSGFEYHLLNTEIGTTNELYFKEPVEYINAPEIGSLCAFVEDGKELDLIITQIKPGKDYSATITAIDYAPARFNPLGTIPPFESNITRALDMTIPEPPTIVDTIRSDESVMIRNSDGSYTSLMLIKLKNTNETNVTPVVRARVVGATQWFNPNYLKRTPTEVILTGFLDGVTYDVEIRYQRLTNVSIISKPYKVGNYLFVGGSTPPSRVADFKVSVANGIGLFEWSQNTDFDLSHYVIKFTSQTDGVTWENAQIVVQRVQGNSISLPIHKGTYLIKAVDILGNESIDATTIISNDFGLFKNVVETLTQEPDWNGVFENTYLSNGNVVLSAGYTEGYYYFSPNTLDLSEVYENSLTSSLKTSLISRDTVRQISSIRSVDSIRTFGDIEGIRSVDSIRNLLSIRNPVGFIWSVSLEMNFSNDNITWTGWKPFTASQHTFRYAKFRLHLTSESEHLTPEVLNASITVDMPDRYESEEDVEIIDAEAGKTITYVNKFRNNPSVNITLQDGDVNDKIEYINKTNEGFTIKIFNTTSNSYVIRTFDYISAGYGRVL